ncbi:hypothetical protein PHYBLDRAFT_169866 [Phycomyces blakesleeanus NRRL 1555(-)]|uniref:Uncharacterized protein n=1 Tax=Phycomyces blakesleeanus (strain ATCC 8743b / DSM 1359 / FGSC 10004 / NBRC 33097 / NRRL 1555) TaxID=763407 RepID=A0A167M6K2_PHYB8|nr:hypothetical protein PHYBLDRAFT_169866 [Phycomyces blakesleeanus NRRL 1555(-)]OAD71954.1 hypothetical protein PHYBLDRAFT_169866 [Phycomyces blakesleeanus NRRL 1555(-)]|eukprot:XP_018289994.1 hypothetical protein PHYBLDRAFT_169866 [Phycomyces blakesleeanus NRRL 1555(-)]
MSRFTSFYRIVYWKYRRHCQEPMSLFVKDKSCYSLDVSELAFHMSLICNISWYLPCLKNQILYKFHPDENKSLDIWMHEKLPSQNYCIFTGDLSAYSNNAQHFVFGFQLPSQMMLMRISQSFCLDATHNISACNIEILYSLVTCHPDTGKGSPVAYMITNDHSVGPINQWLIHLCEKSCFTPLYIIIDYNIIEVNAITAALPQTIIHFCKFHVLRAWQHNLDSNVKLDTSYTSEQLGKYKYELKADFKNILIESDKDEFLRKIQEFRLHIQSQQQFLTYFKQLLRRWGRPYVANDYQRYLANNYIESWHNQLKTIYFGHTCIRRLDCLIFILTNDVEFFYNEKIGNSMENSNGKWTVKSFTVQRENNHLQLQRSLASEHEVAVVNEEVENERNTVVVSGRNNSVWLQSIMAQNTTLYYQREDLEQLMDVPGIDEAKLQVISNLLGEAMNCIDTLRNANSSCFRNLNTQR